MEVSSPVCYADELDAAYRDAGNREELLAALNELLEAERAGACITLRSAAETDDPALQRLVTDIHRDEVRWCGVLIDAIQSLAATPSTRTGAFYERAMAVPELAARMALLNRGQGWVVRKLQALLPRIGDAHVHGELTAMLVSHQQNIARVDAQQQAADPAPDGPTQR
ncbi:2-nitropropane dioxygenase [Variovorax sp. RO1]|nr:2-nitropropane dioxygenase [Variovorax sp. RO1]